MTERPEPRSQSMPMDRAILWNPPAAPGSTNPGRPSSRTPYPIFFQQEAVIALQEHLKSSPTQAIFGFLIGDLYRDPETGVLYVVIDKTLKLSQAIYGDKTEVVVSRLWDRMQQQLAKAHAALLGWYHSHPGQGGFLTPHDVETHEKFFTEPWHVAVLVAAEAGGVTGRFFRAGQSTDWHKAALPFYELLQPDSIKPDGKKRSFITWRNYKAYGPTLTGPKPKAAPAPPPPKAEEPEEEEEEVEAREEAPTEAAPKPKNFRIMRSSADDIPVIRSSADDEPAAAPAPEPVAPPEPPPPPPPPPRASQAQSKRREPSDQIPWEVTPESVASLPPPDIEPAAPAPAPSRRISQPKFRLLDEPEPKPAAPRLKYRRARRHWAGKILLLLVLGGVGGGAYWYVKIKPPNAPPPWAGIVDKAKKLIAKIKPAHAPSPHVPPAPPPAATRRVIPPPRVTAPPPAAPPVAPAAPPVAPPVAPASPFARFDRLSDSLSRAVRNFQDRATLFANGQADCQTLARGLVTIENLWITYNTERRARMTSFDQRRATQDQALYAAVDSVESRFEHSGCSRP